MGFFSSVTHLHQHTHKVLYRKLTTLTSSDGCSSAASLDGIFLKDKQFYYFFGHVKSDEGTNLIRVNDLYFVALLC